MKEEILSEETKTKRKYRFVDTENEVDQLSRKVFKEKNVEIHYPRGFEGGQKYKTESPPVC